MGEAGRMRIRQEGSRGVEERAAEGHAHRGREAMSRFVGCAAGGPQFGRDLLELGETVIEAQAGVRHRDAPFRGFAELFEDDPHAIPVRILDFEERPEDAGRDRTLELVEVLAR
jgi:hypothetical protein